MSFRNDLGESEFATVTSREMHVWRDKLTCISRRLQDELGARMHRHRIPLGNASEEDHTAFDWITETCIHTFKAATASLWTVGNQADGLILQSLRGKGLARPEVRTPEPESGLLDVLRAGEPVILPSRGGTGTEMAVPIALGERTIGVVHVGSRPSGEAYTDEDLDTLRFMVEVAAVCCHLALQEQKVRQALRELAVLSLVADDSGGVPRAA
jgi:GAF domain-containing protein